MNENWLTTYNFIYLFLIFIKTTTTNIKKNITTNLNARCVDYLDYNTKLIWIFFSEREKKINIFYFKLKQDPHILYNYTCKLYLFSFY